MLYKSQREIYDLVVDKLTLSQYVRASSAVRERTYTNMFQAIKKVSKSKAIRDLCDLGMVHPVYQIELKYAPWRV